MSDYVTSAVLKKELRAQTDELTDLMKTFMVQVDERFNIVEARLDDLDTKFDRLLNTVDGFVARLEKWIEQLAKKTNTKLTV